MSDYRLGNQMRKLIYILILSLLWAGSSRAQSVDDFRKAYSEEYREALAFVKKHRAEMDKILPAFQVDPRFMVSVVFPEIVRFSEVSNLMETASLELLYVRFGKYYADFSIGRFQMKPSFVEKLEAHIKAYDFYAFSALITYPDTSAKMMRKERLKRLRDSQWQFQYLAAFYWIVQHKFPLEWTSEAERLKFYATAYNRGFDQNLEEIKKWISKTTFPYGPGYRGRQYAYSEIALDFFQKQRELFR